METKTEDKVVKYRYEPHSTEIIISLITAVVALAIVINQLTDFSSLIKLIFSILILFFSILNLVRLTGSSFVIILSLTHLIIEKHFAGIKREILSIEKKKITGINIAPSKNNTYTSYGNIVVQDKIREKVTITYENGTFVLENLEQFNAKELINFIKNDIKY